MALFIPTTKTLDQVRDTLAEVERDNGKAAAAVMARMMVKHGNVTPDARSYAAEWRAGAAR
jgi:hypothetical protein